jgi:hypothetical protein
MIDNLFSLISVQKPGSKLSYVEVQTTIYSVHMLQNCESTRNISTHTHLSSSTLWDRSQSDLR